MDVIVNIPNHALVKPVIPAVMICGGAILSGHIISYSINLINSIVYQLFMVVAIAFCLFLMIVITAFIIEMPQFPRRGINMMIAPVIRRIPIPFN